MVSVSQKGWWKFILGFMEQSILLHLHYYLPDQMIPNCIQSGQWQWTSTAIIKRTNKSNVQIGQPLAACCSFMVTHNSIECDQRLHMCKIREKTCICFMSAGSRKATPNWALVFPSTTGILNNLLLKTCIIAVFNQMSSLNCLLYWEVVLFC